MIYFVQCGKDGPIKIGCSDDVEKRIAQMQIGCPYELALLWQIKGDNEDEASLHEQWKHEKVRGEWFHPSEQLLLYINREASNQYSYKFETGYITLIESRYNFFIDGNGFQFAIKKHREKLGVFINNGYPLHIETNGKVFEGPGDNEKCLN